MATPKKQIIQPVDLGKGLTINPLTKLVDLSISSDQPNNAQFGNDNGLVVNVMTAVVGSVPSDNSVLEETDSLSTSLGKLQSQIIAMATVQMVVSYRDVEDPTYVYFGGLLSTGDWQINRWEISTNQKTIATNESNSMIEDLDSAWGDRSTLEYTQP